MCNLYCALATVMFAQVLQTQKPICEQNYPSHRRCRKTDQDEISIASQHWLMEAYYYYYNTNDLPCLHSSCPNHQWWYQLIIDHDNHNTSLGINWLLLLPLVVHLFVHCVSQTKWIQNISWIWLKETLFKSWRCLFRSTVSFPQLFQTYGDFDTRSRVVFAVIS